MGGPPTMLAMLLALALVVTAAGAVFPGGLGSALRQAGALGLILVGFVLTLVLGVLGAGRLWAYDPALAKLVIVAVATALTVVGVAARARRPDHSVSSADEDDDDGGQPRRRTPPPAPVAPPPVEPSPDWAGFDHVRAGWESPQRDLEPV